MIQYEQAASGRRSDAVSAAGAFVHVAFVYLPVFLAAAVGPSPILVLFWLWFGLGKNGLINLMHECAHRLAFRRAWANELLGCYVLAPLVITDFESYRERHWEHHRHLGTARDGKVVYRSDIRGTRIMGLVVRCMLGVEAIRRLTERPPDTSGEVGAKHATLSPRLVVAQLVLVSSLAVVAFLAHPDPRSAMLALGLAYGGVYGYGLSSVTVLAAALRAIAEHQIGRDAYKLEGEAALRNLSCNSLTRLLFGAYGFAEHATHHLQPGIPHYRLREVTARLAESEPSLLPKRGYLGTLLDLILSRPPTGPDADQQLRQRQRVQ